MIDIWRRGGDWAQQRVSLRHVVGLFSSLGRDRAAVVLYGALNAAGATTALPYEPNYVELLEQTVVVLRGRMGADAFDAAYADGQALGDVVEFALAEIREILKRSSAGTEHQ